MQISIERKPTAFGTNLADKNQPVIYVRWPGGYTIMGRWTTLCLDEGSITADKATDEQIKRAILTDESVF